MPAPARIDAGPRTEWTAFTYRSSGVRRIAENAAPNIPARQMVKSEQKKLPCIFFQWPEKETGNQ